MGEEQLKSREEKKEVPKTDEKNGGKKEEKNPEKPKVENPPPPPQEIILRVYMHCEGCARKIHRCLIGFAGVENVMTDCKSGKVVVKGEKADPLKVLERVQKKSHRQVELISPIPKPPPPPAEPKKPQQLKSEEKKDELPAVTVVLGVYMHCEACAQEIKKRILKMKGVETAEPDLKNSHVVVKGLFEPEKLVSYLHKRTGKHAEIKKVEPEKKEKEKVKEGEEVKKVEEAKKSVAEGKENKDNGGTATEPPPAGVKPDGAEMEDSKLDLRKLEFYYYPQNHQVYPQRLVPDNFYAYPPQLFSDENPNACSVM